MQNFLDKLSLEYVMRQLMKGTLADRKTFVSQLDERVLLVWQAFFSLAPFIVKDLKLLIFFFILVAVVAFLSHVTLLVFLIFVLSVMEKFAHIFIVSLFFGGNADTLLPVLILMLKTATVSLSAVAVYTTMNPQRLALALEYFHFPMWLVLSISLGYRMLPVVMGEYTSILTIYRERENMPERNGVRSSVRWFVCQIKILIFSFYPLMLNTAKRARTLGEVMEVRGYYEGMDNKNSKQLRFSKLKITKKDVLFLCISTLWCVSRVFL